MPLQEDDSECGLGLGLLFANPVGWTAFLNEVLTLRQDLPGERL